MIGIWTNFGCPAGQYAPFHFLSPLFRLGRLGERCVKGAFTTSDLEVIAAARRMGGIVLLPLVLRVGAR